MAHAQEFKLPDPGEGIHEVEIRKILVATGDSVAEGDQVVVIETDKAAYELTSPYNGRVADVRVSEGDVVHTGDVLLTVGSQDDSLSLGGDRQREDRKRKGTSPKTDADASRDTPSRPAAERQKGSDERKEKKEQGSTRKAAAEAERHAEALRAPAAKSGEAERPVPATPAVRRKAREMSTDLREVEGTGAGGRITKDDLRARSKEPPEETRAAGGDGRDHDAFGPVERIGLRSLRRAIAKRTARAWQEIPHVTHHDLIDITELEALRLRHKAEIEAIGGKLTVTAFVAKAAAAALAAFPRFNASFDSAASEILLKHYYNFGIAIDTDRGVMVPVVPDVDRKSVTTLAVELAALDERRRGGDARREDLAGGTFTITNVGPLGGTYFTPIINHPEVAILGMGQARLMPVASEKDGDMRIMPRLMLPLILAFDHRVADGADAARFMERLRTILTDPESFALAA